MSKKNNLITLRPKAKKAYIISINNDNKFAKNHIQAKNLIHFLQRKGCWILRSTILQNNNIIKITLHVLISKKKIRTLKKRKKKIKFTKKLFSKKFNDYLLKIFNSLNCLLKVKIVNKYINKRICKKYNKHFFKYKRTLFNRRQMFYFDTLRAISLFRQPFFHASLLLNILTSIFKFLSKKLHNLFLIFVRHLIIRLCIQRSLRIRGIKFRINGRLKGKLRASSRLFIKNTLKNQSMDKPVEYVFSHVFTRFGLFGFHLWICKRNKKYK